MSNERYKNCGICKECNQPNTGENWCQSCNSKRFQQDFNKWTSGNQGIDKFIQKCQLEATSRQGILEWVPYDKFTNIEYLAEGGFGTVCKAIWIDGYITHWNIENNKWERGKAHSNRILKRLNNSQDMNAEFLNEVICNKLVDTDSWVVRCYGISQDPETKNYVMVMDYISGGDMRHNKQLSFKEILSCLYAAANGLSSIHKKGLVHRDLHSGNILGHGWVADLGLSRPANLSNEGKIYGVLPYVAPEVLRGKQYTQPADIYSFGIVAYELVSGLSPYHNLAHDNFLAFKICEGLRPELDSIKVPQLFKDLIMKCLDADPLIRPTAKELKKIFNIWMRVDPDDGTYYNPEYYEGEIDDKMNEEFYKQYEEYKKELNKISNDTTCKKAQKTHPQAKYTSRLLDFKNLPEPPNSKDINTQFYNSAEYSKSLLVDFTDIKGNIYI